MSDKIHQRVAEVLGMELEEETEAETYEPDYGTTPDTITAVVPVPETVASDIDNPELPPLHDEMLRIEHGQRQTEVLLNRGIATVQQALGEIALMPPIYKARAMEAAAELFKAVADLNKFKVEVQIKLSDLKMKQASFTRNRPAQPNHLGTGNTFVFNREEVMRVINEQIKNVDTNDEDK